MYESLGVCVRVYMKFRPVSKKKSVFICEGFMFNATGMSYACCLEIPAFWTSLSVEASIQNIGLGLSPFYFGKSRDLAPSTHI